jgi:hypothetical protein
MAVGKRAWALLFLLVATPHCGEEDDWKDTNKPATFMNSCSLGDGTCAAPFDCLQTTSRSSPFCTLECQSDSECPSWNATGHCPGFRQSGCVDGACVYESNCR